MRRPSIPLRVGLLALGAAAVGCLHAPPPRPLSGGETIVLGTVLVRVPPEPGWYASDVSRPNVRVLELTHRGESGAADRMASITEEELPRGTGTPEEFLEWVNRPLSPDAPPAHPPFVLDGRFGSRSVHATLPSDASDPSLRAVAGPQEVAIFVPPGRVPPRVVTARAAEPPIEGPPARDPMLAGLRLRQWGTAAEAEAVPDLEEREWAAYGAGPAFAWVRGRAMAGATLRVGGAGESIYPSSGRGLGYSISSHAFLGADEDAVSLVYSMDFGIRGVHGRFRYGLGVDFGLVQLREGSAAARRDLALGSRAFLGIALGHHPNAPAIEFEAIGLAPGFVQGSVSLVWRKGWERNARAFPLPLTLPLL